MKSAYVGRLAPSPTGKLHLGLARSLLAAWLDARAHAGKLILRIEDIDGPRVVSGAEEGICRDLEWLGVDWDEGPGRTTKFRQSERVELYESALATLERAGRIVRCSCSRKDLAEAGRDLELRVTEASAPHEAREARYPGTCRLGPTRPERPLALRFRTELGDIVAHTDRLFGPSTQDVFREVGDFVIRRSDGLWAYQLAVTVDDLEQGVTCVVRGRDLLSSTHRQKLLRRVLRPEAPEIETLHLPLVLGPEGKRLAKRDQAASLEALRHKGSGKIIGTLAYSLGLVDRPDPVSAEALVSVWRDHWRKVRLADAQISLDP